MPYTIRPLGTITETALRKLRQAFEAAVTRGARFTCKFACVLGFHAEIHVTNVRLVESKFYCGQHAGPCDLPQGFPRKPKKMKLLEWEDWQAFHAVVNSVLDKGKVSADCWSFPPDTALDKGKKLWIRRGDKRRTQYDYAVAYRPGGMPFYKANHGSPDQFTGGV